MRAYRQTTLCESATVTGVGVHSGAPVNLTLHPAEAGSGVVFLRTGLASRPDCEIPVHVHSVTATDFATVLGDESGPLCSTAEHVLAALSAMGVDNAVVEVDGPEVPIMDGSAEPFVAAIDRAGIVTQSKPRRYIEVLKTVRVSKDGAYGEIRPHSRGFRVDCEIEFDHPLIGRQSYGIDVEPVSFRRDIARARTFGFMRDVSKLWSAGYARGASLENTLVIAEDRILNPEGARFADEFARHKVLDAIGDLALAGAPLIGAYRSVRGGHKLNHAVLSALMADSKAWTYVDAAPLRRPRHAEATAGLVTPGLVAPAFGPDLS